MPETSIPDLGPPRQIFERAMAAKRGIKITMSSKSSATNLRQRLNRFRQDDRKESMLLYPDPNDDKHNYSSYDVFELCVIENILEIRRTGGDINGYLVEEI